MESGHWGYVVALLISSLINAVLFFRIFEIAYFGKKPAEGHGHHDDHSAATINEARPSALLPLLATAVIIVQKGDFSWIWAFGIGEAKAAIGTRRQV